MENYSDQHKSLEFATLKLENKLEVKNYGAMTWLKHDILLKNCSLFRTFFMDYHSTNFGCA